MSFCDARPHTVQASHQAQVRAHLSVLSHSPTVVKPKGLKQQLGIDAVWNTLISPPSASRATIPAVAGERESLFQLYE